MRFACSPKVTGFHITNSASTCIPLVRYPDEVVFLKKGVDVLTTNNSISAAEACYCSGDTTRAREYCHVVIGIENKPLLDKEVAYNVLLTSYNAAGQHHQAMQICLSLLDKLGCRFPKFCGTALGAVEMLRAKSKAKSYSRLIPNLPTIESPEIRWIILLLE